MRSILAATLAGILLAAPVPIFAQGAGIQQTSIGADQIRAKDLIDRDVYTTDGIKIGEVEDLVLNPSSGRVILAVIELEGRLGFTEKYVAVPVDRLRAESRRVTIGMTRDELRALPRFDYRD